MTNQTTQPSQNISILLPNGDLLKQPKGTTPADIQPTTAPNELPHLGALINNDVCSLSYPLDINCSLRYLTFADREGLRIYRRSLTLLLAKTIKDLFPTAQFSVEHSLNTGYYCSFNNNRHPGINETDLQKLQTAMLQNIADKLPIQRSRLSFQDAYDKLQAESQTDKLNLLRYRNPPKITVFHIGDFYDLGHGVMAPNTGVLDQFQLLPYDLGFILQFPELKNGQMQRPPYQEVPHLHEVFSQHKKWGKAIGIQTVGDLNTTIADKKLTNLIRTAEAFHDKKLAHIADEISQRTNIPKYIFIAGPSSAGKTTFSKRLAIHLRVNGLQPINIECDNYFVNREDNPTDPNGEPDFEHLEAIDLPLFNDHLAKLSAGEKIQRPTFNFHTGQREYNGATLQLTPDQIVIIEGIHALNPRLSQHIPDQQKYKIYINALTQLRLDNNNRISTTDLRLIRRLIRDNATRGHSSLRTLQLWPNVRRGEKRWIFPYQQQADIMFNSSLEYELSVFKPLVRPLLAQVKPTHPEYAEARRLLAFMDMIISAPHDTVPPDSLLREFLGGSAFNGSTNPTQT